MGIQTLPCPACSAPIALGFWTVRPTRGAIDGICPECLKAYRFTARARYAVAGSWIAAGLLAAGLYAAFAQCDACVQLQDAPAFALAPVVLLLAAVPGLALAASLALRICIRNAQRAGGDAALLEAVDEADIPFAAGNRRPRPLTALVAAVLLLAMLAWAIVLELHAVDRHSAADAVPNAETAAAAGDPFVVGLFLALDVLLALLVVACGAVVVRRIVRNARASAGSGNTSVDA